MEVGLCATTSSLADVRRVCLTGVDVGLRDAPSSLANLCRVSLTGVHVGLRDAPSSLAVVFSTLAYRHPCVFRKALMRSCNTIEDLSRA